MEQTSEKQSFLSISQYNWDDVKPISQRDPELGVLNLQYSKNYEQMMDYFRAILVSQEISPRVNELTKFIVKKSCTNYNAWYIRKLCIEKLKIDIQEEITFINELTIGNEKNFQMWDHRKYLINKLNKCDGELQFLAGIFNQDNKNYHAWQYRIWLCQRFQLYEEELKNVEFLINSDIKNNSAWNYKFFLISVYKYKSIQDIKQEVAYSLKRIEECFDNESAWNYLFGFFKMYQFKTMKSQQLSNEGGNPILQHEYKDFPEILEFCLKFYEQKNINRFLLVLLVQIYISKNEKQSIIKAINYISMLAKEYDIIRQNYWLWFDNNLKQDFEELLKAN